MAEGDEYLDYLDKIHVRVGGETLECFVRGISRDDMAGFELFKAFTSDR